MYKLLLFTILGAFFMMLQAMQVDQELAMHSLFQAKYALNRSTHAAAQQLDHQKLSLGLTSIDEQIAYDIAMVYLQKNLNLDKTNVPHPDSFLRSKVEVLEFAVINEQETFPFTYINLDYNYRVTVDAPSVVMIIRIIYPRTFNILGPITWEIKGTAEVVNMIY